MRTGRNKPCPCGSGRKYKQCCLSKQGERGASVADDFQAQLLGATQRALEHGEEDIVSAISDLERLTRYSSATEDQRQSAKGVLAQAYQRRGEHVKALEVLSSLGSVDSNAAVFVA